MLNVQKGNMNKENILVLKKCLVKIMDILQISPIEIQEITSVDILEEQLRQEQIDQLLIFVDCMDFLKRISGNDILVQMGWLKSSNFSFNYISPLEKMKSKEGLLEVRDYLYRIANK